MKSAKNMKRNLVRIFFFFNSDSCRSGGVMTKNLDEPPK